MAVTEQDILNEIEKINEREECSGRECALLCKGHHYQAARDAYLAALDAGEPAEQVRYLWAVMFTWAKQSTCKHYCEPRPQI